MLALTHKEQQAIVIGDEIEISVVAIQGRRVRLGVKRLQRLVRLR